MAKDAANNRLKKNYPLRIQLGLIGSLSLFLLAFTLPIQTTSLGEIRYLEPDEALITLDIPLSEQITTPPPPPLPQTPVEVPNDEIMDVQLEIPDIDYAWENIPAPQPIDDGDNKGDSEEPYLVVETYPELKGGLKSLSEKLNYPEMARKAGIEGLVVVRFVVEKDGTVSNPVVLRGIGGGCDEEALRVVSDLQFRPGLQQGRTVRVQYSLPIRFTLPN